MPEDAIVLLFCCAYIAVHGLVVVSQQLRCSSGVFSWSLRCQDIFGRVRRVFALLRGRPQIESSEESRLLAVHVEAALHEQRLRLIFGACRIVATIFVFILMAIAWCTVNGFQRWLTAFQTVMIWVCYPLFCYLGYFAREAALPVLRVFWFISFTAIGVFTLFATPNVMAVVCAYWICQPYRFLMSCFAMDTWFLLAANTTVTLMILIALARAEPVPQDILPLKAAHIMVMEALVLIALFMSSSFYEDSVYYTCRHDLELSASKSESSAAATVLNAVCDAVVQLDDSLCVVNQGRKLAALLLQPGRDLTGSSFPQFLQERGGQKDFVEWLEGPPRPTDSHIGFQSRLRDSVGSPIFVEMFHVPFEKMPGFSHHFIGILEKGIGWTTNSEPGGDTYPEEMRCEVPIVPRDFDTSSDASRSDLGEVGSGDEEAIVPEVDSCPTFRFDTANLEITGSSAGFSIGTHGAPQRGTSLVCRLKKCDTNTRYFFQDYAINLGKLLNRARETDDPLEVGFHTTLVYTPHGCRERFCMRVRVLLGSLWPPGANRRDRAQSPCVTGTVVILSVRPEDSGEANSSGSSSNGTSRSSLGPHGAESGSLAEPASEGMPLKRASSGISL